MNQKHLKELFGDLEPAAVERQAKVVVDEDLEKSLNNLLDVYKTSVACEINPYQLDEFAFYSICLAQLKRTSCDITEKVISELVLRIMRHNNMFNFGINAGQFVTACIQESYWQGHNNFELAITEPLRGLGTYLRGGPDKKLILTVNNFAADSDVLNRVTNLQGWFTNAAYLDATIWGAGNVPVRTGFFFGYRKYTNGTQPVIGYEAKDSVFRVDDAAIFEYLTAAKYSYDNEVYLLEKPEPEVVVIEHNHEKAELNLAIEA